MKKNSNSANGSASQRTFSVIDEKLQSFLTKKGYEVLMRTSVESHGTYTYHVEKEEMPYWVKLGHSETPDRWEEIGYQIERSEGRHSRIDDLRNEVAALIALWRTFPSGETDSFQFPPGPEEVFEDTVDGLEIYGYARFLVEGKVLGKALMDGSTTFNEWLEPCVKMVRTIDTLPDLHLPRTIVKKTVDFEKLIVKNASFWYDRLKIVSTEGAVGVDEELLKQADSIVQNTRSYLSGHKVVKGTVHGDFQPEHIVYLEEHGLPTLVQFSKLCQWYPRYWDVANMYGWVAVVLGNIEAAQLFWKRLIERNGLSKDEIDYLKVITNVVTLGTMSTFVEPGWKGGKLKVGVAAFV